MKPEFEYKAVDLEGLETLDVLSEADKFNQWMYETILPYCSGNVLEVGSGTGNISQYFLKNNHKICLSDIRDNYCEILKEKFKSHKNLINVVNLDLIDSDFDNRYKDLIGKFETVFALNVVEHIENDSLAIANCHKLLKKDGMLIILVPAFQWLYNSFDKELYHYRRYVKKSLVKLFEPNGFKVINAFYFNVFGVAGWFTLGSLLKKKIIPKSPVRIYNSLLPVMKMLDMLFLKKFGLSVIVAGKKI
jgi:SAM-dependent methyltransferase